MAPRDPQSPPRTTLLNPRLIVEVLSPSTELYDRGKKLAKYFEIASLREYVLVAQTEPRLDSYFRHPDGTWAFSISSGMESSLRLGSLEISIPLKEVYSGVSFPLDSELTPEIAVMGVPSTCRTKTRDARSWLTWHLADCPALSTCRRRRTTILRCSYQAPSLRRRCGETSRADSDRGRRSPPGPEHWQDEARMKRASLPGRFPRPERVWKCDVLSSQDRTAVSCRGNARSRVLVTVSYRQSVAEIHKWQSRLQLAGRIISHRPHAQR